MQKLDSLDGTELLLKAMWECDYLAFVKAFDSVVSQGNEELSGSAKVKGQSSAGLSCLLN